MKVGLRIRHGEGLAVEGRLGRQLRRLLQRGPALRVGKVVGRGTALASADAHSDLLDDQLAGIGDITTFDNV